MLNLIKRVKKLEEGNTADIIYNVYCFNPSEKIVYRTYEDKRIYMDYDAVMAEEYDLASTIVAVPNTDDNPNWAEELDGIWYIALGGRNVINENN